MDDLTAAGRFNTEEDTAPGRFNTEEDAGGDKTFEAYFATHSLQTVFDTRITFRRIWRAVRNKRPDRPGYTERR